MADEIARRLRKTMAPQEVKLWVHLRSWRQRGFHFRHRSPRSGSIVDFVCLRHRLIVEVDGGQHNFEEHAWRDRVRDQGFERDGYKVLRFWNTDVDNNLQGVLAAIDSTLRRSTPPVPRFAAATLPFGEG